MKKFTKKIKYTHDSKMRLTKFTKDLTTPSPNWTYIENHKTVDGFSPFHHRRLQQMLGKKIPYTITLMFNFQLNHCKHTKKRT
jgi:hypothetical protein